MKPMLRIDDLDDPRLDAFRGLRDADLRGARSLFTVESERVLERFLRSGWPVDSVLVEEDVHGRLQMLLDDLDETVPVYVTDNGSLDGVSGYEFHRGALALGIRPSGRSPGLGIEDAAANPPCTLLAADGVAHVDNMGSLFRNAACLGASGLVLGPGCADPLFRKTIRVSSGHVFGVPWEAPADFHSMLDAFRKELDFTIIGLELCEDSDDIVNMTISDRTIMIVGSEGTGLSERSRALCDQIVHIPGLAGNDRDSLNVAVSSAIGLHELGRRRRW